MISAARLARAWGWRLPGAATLAVERIATLSTGAPRVARHAAGDADDADDADPSAPRASLAGVRRRSAYIRVALGDARAALIAADAPAAATHVVAARTAAAALLDPILDAWIDLCAASVALADGAVDLAAVLSVRAEDGARRAFDEPTFLATWWARAIRALRRGSVLDGAQISAWIRPRLTAAAPELDGWLRCFEGATHLDDGRVHAAITVCAPVLTKMAARAPGWAAGALIARGFVALGRPDDAARIAVASLEHAAAAPTAVRAQCYLDVSRALAAARLVAPAARCAAVAHALDPHAAAAPDAAELVGAGLELRLLW